MEQSHQLHDGQQHSPSVSDRRRFLHIILRPEHTIGFVAMREGTDFPHRDQGRIYGLGENRDGIVDRSCRRRRRREPIAATVVRSLCPGNDRNGMGDARRRGYHALPGRSDHAKRCRNDAERHGATRDGNRCGDGTRGPNDTRCGVGIEHGMDAPSGLLVRAFQGVVHGDEHRGCRPEHAKRRERQILRPIGANRCRPGPGRAHATAQSRGTVVLVARACSGDGHPGRRVSSEPIVSRPNHEQPHHTHIRIPKHNR
mmetsp:Transcript_13169/g.30992  ORF Transcript_13169/g.30992 Transcript_13169/m.30992 type:complete len:256 (-) Transcript_13169:1472-2239(-)